MKVTFILSLFLACVAAQQQPLDNTLASPQQPVDHAPDFSPLTFPHGADPLLTLHYFLVSIESLSGHEGAITTYLTHQLRRLNYTVDAQPVSPSRSNIHAYIGHQRTTKTLVTSHLDTVPPFYGYSSTGSTISGRGAVDAKGSIAAQLIAVEELRRAGKLHEGDVSLLFVVGEETGGEGMRAVNALGLEWDTVIFGEPTDLSLAAGHKGLLGFTLRVKGKGGHSGYPELGVDANAKLLDILHHLRKLELPSSTRYGNSTLNIGHIEGGVAGNVIAADARAEVVIRLAAGTPAEFKKLVQGAVDAAPDNGAEVSIEWSSEGYGPVHIDSDVPGFETTIVSYGTDIPNLQGGHKRYLYGPGSILVAHSDHEGLATADLFKAVEGYKKLILHSLNKTTDARREGESSAEGE